MNQVARKKHVKSACQTLQNLSANNEIFDGQILNYRLVEKFGKI